MVAPLVVVTGVGTGVGKTHVAEALLLAWGKVGRVAGFKPVETGVDPLAATDDGSRLERASTFHVKHSERAVRLHAPVSAHLAAEREGRVLDPGEWVRVIDELRDACDGVVVELAGGLFSPLGPALTNADVVARLQPDKTLLVASDRLGVLHDVIAASRACPLAFDVLLTAPETLDASTGTNAVELRRFVAHRVLGALPRATPAALSEHSIISSLISEVRVARGPS